VDVEFLDDTQPDLLVLRAGGAPSYKLGIAPAWFDAFRVVVRDAAFPGRFGHAPGSSIP
jgi:hypothetical protein